MRFCFVINSLKSYKQKSEQFWEQTLCFLYESISLALPKCSKYTKLSKGYLIFDGIECKVLSCLSLDSLLTLGLILSFRASAYHMLLYSLSTCDFNYMLWFKLQVSLEIIINLIMMIF